MWYSPQAKQIQAIYYNCNKMPQLSHSFPISQSLLSTIQNTRYISILQHIKIYPSPLYPIQNPQIC